MEDPNITMEEFIRIEEKKTRRRGKVYNWETATYGKIWYGEDVNDLRSVETEFPTVVFEDELSSEKTLSCEQTVSSLNNNEIDFRISFDESNDEDYTVIFEKNSFSYKIIYVNNLKTDSENDNEKVNTPSFSSPKPTISYFDDLDFLKDFENEFLAIIYNDALTSKLDSSTKPVEIHHHIDEFDLKTETSLSKCDEEEQNVYMALLPRDQRHQYLRFERLEYKNTDITNFEERLGRIYDREIHRVQVFDFGGLTELMDEGFSGISSDLGTTPSYTSIRDPMLRLCHKLIACSIAGRSQAPEKVTVTDLFYLRGMDVGSVNIPYLLARLHELTVIVRDLPMIDMAELVRLHICEELENTWAWVASGPERQQVAAIGAHVMAKDAPVVDEGAPAVPAPAQAPQAPPTAGPARTMAQRLGRLEEDVHGLQGALGEKKEVLDNMAHDFS
ncbi:hypothetical protein Tco_0832848 [Tanacetum coccineum]